MVEFLKRLFGSGDESSAKAAKERLRIVLIHDRTDISPQLLDNLRMEMTAVLTRYMEIDENKIEIDLDHDDKSVALVVNVPIVQVKRGGTENPRTANGERNSAPETPRAQNPHKNKRHR